MTVSSIGFNAQDQSASHKVESDFYGEIQQQKWTPSEGNEIEMASISVLSPLMFQFFQNVLNPNDD